MDRRISHPLEHWPASRRRWWWCGLLATTLALLLTMSHRNRSLKTDAAPRGIISFELAQTVDRAAAIVDSRDASTRQDARHGLWLDFLFLVSYSNLLAAWCVWAAGVLRRTYQNWLDPVGVVLAWGQWGAALFDVLENFASCTSSTTALRIPGRKQPTRSHVPNSGC